MAVHYLKKAAKTPETGEDETRDIVDRMLREIRAGGEDAVRAYAARLDQWTGEIVVTPDVVAKRTASLPETVKDDIRFAHDQVFRFAQRSGKACTSSRSSSIRVSYAGRS